MQILGDFTGNSFDHAVTLVKQFGFSNVSEGVKSTLQSSSGMNLERDEFLRVLSESEYDDTAIDAITKQVVLCYALWNNELNKPKNLIIYTVDSNQQVTRWSQYYHDLEFSHCGSLEDFMERARDFFDMGFTFVPPY